MGYEKLNEKMLEMKDEIFESIKGIVAIESVKGEPEENAPYGRGPKEALDHTLALGEKLGFKTGNLDNRVGWIEYGDGEEMAAVLGHLDVVPLGEGWNYPPLACEIHDGKMYGRGVLDDKGPVIGAIYALKAIRDLELPIDRRIRVIFGTDEENGSSCVQYYNDAGGEQPAIGFTPDGEFPVIFCEKGQSFWEVTKKIENPSKVKVLSIEGGTAKNVVTPKCTMVVEGNLDIQETEGVTVTKADGRTTIVAEGVGAHGSTPDKGVNAAIKLFEAVKDTELGGDLEQMIRFVLEKIGTETNGKSLDICWTDEETGETTVNLGVVNCNSEELFFTLDIRYPKNADRDTLVEKVKKHAEAYGLDAKIESEGKLLYVPKDSELIQKLMNVYKEETGRDDQPIAIGGGTYAKAFDNMVAFGPTFPDEPDIIHQPNECGDVDNMMLSYQVMAAAMYEIAKK